MERQISIQDIHSDYIEEAKEEELFLIFGGENLVHDVGYAIGRTARFVSDTAVDVVDWVKSL
ncbi:hypothetical protein LC608_29190 [Nostoc sp. XA010]|uniref:hypothetical protein n=1 Tax=Nostoc sp. XA010 TaxID=2780407 RepID=UPI001E2C3B93|nr:hypothetical protein [Nostoc sp. XA010]MCC5660975.1 hypothetical protein [Nostoc sp. XA010]